MAVCVDDGLIAEVRPVQSSDRPALTADIICPGFVDMQINGANDVQFNDTPTVDGIAAIAEGARQGGTTHILPTFITAPGTSYLLAIQAVADARTARTPGILGVHLEGPFLSPKRPGIHPPDCVREIDDADIENLETANCGIRLITLAPECAPKGAIQRLCESGAIVFAGHSAASHDDITHATSEGLRGATHLFNAMSQITVREPGVVGAVLGSQALFAGIIADGVHVHPTNLQIAQKSLGKRFCLVTDTMLTLAGETTEFDVYGSKIYRDGNRLSDETGRLAGAHLAMDEAVRNMVLWCDVSLAEALYMTSVNPIHALGLEAQMGRIDRGYSASMSLLNSDIQAVGTIVDGRLFHSR
jgi:N-acetylglucosamine-6-phosphate deacetylase